MDEIAEYNSARWQALAEADALFTRPALSLTPETAREKVDPEGLFGDLAGKDVLCLAGGGGQQSAAFALLGANVTVFDLSDAQLERDRQVAERYQREIRAVQGDMRDLSALAPASFDLVYQPYALGFVPEASVVFAEAACVLRPGGIYYFAVGNPFYLGVTEADWNGEGYLLKRPYVHGAEIETPDQEWVYDQENASPIQPPKEYRQTLSRLLNSLLALDFSLYHVSDSKDMNPDPNEPPGTWDHRVAFAPPWLAFWLRYLPKSN